MLCENTKLSASNQHTEMMFFFHILINVIKFISNLRLMVFKKTLRHHLFGIKNDCESMESEFSFSATISDSVTGEYLELSCNLSITHARSSWDAYYLRVNLLSRNSIIWRRVADDTLQSRKPMVV